MLGDKCAMLQLMGLLETEGPRFTSKLVITVMGAPGAGREQLTRPV